MKRFFTKKNEVKSRMILLFVLLVIVPFIVAALIIGVGFSRYSISNIGDTTADAVAVIGSRITGEIRKYEETSMSLYYNGYVEQLDPTYEMSEGEERQLNEFLEGASLSNTAVHAIYVRVGEDVFHGGADYVNLFSYMSDFEEEIISAGGKCLWYATNQLWGSQEENKYILARSLNSKDQKNIGIYYMVLDDRMIREAFEQLHSEQAVTYLVDAAGKILYSSDVNEFGQSMDLQMIDTELLRGSKTVQSKDGRQLLVHKRLVDTDWYCIGKISMSDIQGDVMRLEHPFILLGVIYVLFLILMMRMMEKYVFQPLHSLKKSMDQYAQGDLQELHIDVVGIGEFESLSRHFNEMTGRIHSLMEDFKKEEEEKNKQRMKALTSQLTPHFIYNALNTIKWMAVLNHQENIQHLTESLVHIFMNAAKVDDDNYTMEDELTLITNYAVIQKARFMNFELDIQADEESRHCKIRKFLLQPIVENAIVHGLGRGKIKDTVISITAKVDTELYIEVHDDGVGFDVDEWRSHPEAAESHTNIGLHNVEQIIQLEYGEPYRLEIESTPGAGTTMRYVLPALHEGEEE